MLKQIHKNIQKEYKRFIKREFRKLFGKFDFEIGYNVWADVWKNYYIENHLIIQEKINLLKNSLDKDSKKTVDQITERYFFMLPWQKHKNIYLYDENEFFSHEGKLSLNQELIIDRQKYKLPDGIYYEDSIFNYGHGIKLLSGTILSNIKEKDFIDGGAFAGDSAIVLNDYTSAKIYSFEPDAHNFNLLNKTIELNKLENKIIPVQLGISEDEKEITVYPTDFCNSVIALDEKTKQTPIIINTTSIDKFADKNNLNIGLIKLDIEGNELEAIWGAKETIIKNKPILLISIYHHPKDFFEIKPLIESWNLNYKFIIKKLSEASPTYETMLIGWAEN
ncbi:MAG: hypothetical protein UR30_C0005G0044 [Candidatus Peregrinibacteria bacterium GW2011_GWC2_33_13]|nr:MAG: hypothetical protein UR30_C0005G0044 [Candidatus Peregrinibacteria bacterium GW2011_GWC2_33_13]